MLFSITKRFVQNRSSAIASSTTGTSRL